ncbi:MULTISPECIES: hypothetical protein [Bacillales]|uniref:DUF2933 domain-containing protein n=5 Tax=Bacillales TaxID=1385 RepID=A0A6N8CRS4_9BACI|nr:MULTISPECIES: hypothetical protein [Bacillales]RYL92275.1 hypothetical protein EWI07_09550 [Sporolactobacillus sp. THM7-4]KLI01915.1 hypothetical protein SINU_10945 [Sporolactobacillus inulinus CASD]MCQ2010354.1 hypothetical protein [Sporolactobacillus sp. STSJ-5]MTT31625.1 hypothetical protein [Terrilactibacillus tamarindi]SFG59045.1 hypothetical protein SAMN02982927_02131 [Sporolactobacillus nakayamae]
MDWSWLLLLACPLMMLPMMFMMMKGNHSETDHSEHQKSSNELNDLKEQNNLLREQLQQLKNKD